MILSFLVVSFSIFCCAPVWAGCLYATLGASFNIHPGISMLFLMLDLPFFMSLPLIGFPFYPSGHPEKNEHWKCPYSPLMLDWKLDRPRFLHRIFILHDEGIDPLFLAFLLPLRNMMYSDSCFFGLVFLNFFSNPLEAARIILSKVFWNYKHVVISLHLLCGN